MLRTLFTTFVALLPWALIAHENWTLLVLLNLFTAIGAVVWHDQEPCKASHTFVCGVLLTFIAQTIYFIAL
jgi:hypothetical protein